VRVGVGDHGAKLIAAEPAPFALDCAVSFGRLLMVELTLMLPEAFTVEWVESPSPMRA